MKDMRKRLFLLGLCLLIGAGLAHAQTATTGQITGTVYDPQNAVVVGAKVVAESEAGLRRETTSDASGEFQFALLPPGVYRVEVTATGFGTTVVEGVVVKITDTTHVHVNLQLAAAATERITVTAEPPLVQSESPTRGEVIQSGTLRQLPLPTRNFQQLLTLTAGTSGSLPNSSELGRGDTVFNVNGQRSLSNAVVINGVDANSIGTGSTPNLAVPATDSLQEFIVQTSLYDASQGRNAGGIVAAVTRSGTNAYHGNVYCFFRRTGWNANNFFLNAADQERPEYTRDQCGGTLGGPIQKDKWWFFLSYQGSDEKNGTSLTNSIATVFVPLNLTDNRADTDADFLAFLNSFGGLTPATVNPAAKFLLQSRLPSGEFAIPSAAGATAGATNTATPTPVSGISKFREQQFNLNTDYQFTGANRLIAKFFWANNPAKQALFNSFGTGNALPLPGFGAAVDFKQRLLSVADTHVFSPSLLNEARFGYGIITTASVPEEPFTAADLGISAPLSSRFPGMPTITVSNFFDLGASPFSDNDAQVSTYTVGDTVTWTAGKHTLKFGGEFKYHIVDLRFDLYTRGNMFHLGFSGNPFRDFLGGFFGLNGLSIMGSGVNNRGNRAQDHSFFLNDDWRISKQFTVTWGVRYEYFGPFTEVDGRYVAFDIERATTVVIPPNPPFTTSPGVAITGGLVQAGNAKDPLPGVPLVRDSLVDPDRNNFGPRLGFAWQPFSSTGRFVIRGGYGFYFDRPNARLLNNQILDFPYYTLAQVLTAPISSPFVQVPMPEAFPLNFNDPAIFPNGGPPAVLPATVAGSACAPLFTTCVPSNGLYPDVHNFRIPYIQQYNLSFQYEFVRNWLLDAGYVGSAGHKLLRLRTLNNPASTAFNSPGPFSPGLSSLPVQAFGTHVMQSSADSNYNSLQVSLTKRYSAGLQFLLAYTYAHSIDEYSGDPSGTSDNSVVPGNVLTLDNRASSDYDRRHRLVFSYIYDFPNAYKGDSRVAKWILNDWEIAGIVTLQTGTPFSVLTNATAFVQARANFAAGCTDPSFDGGVKERLGAYFNVSCFQAASGVGNFGNTGRNILRGPDQRNVDFSVIKFFPLDEQRKFEFRTEFFNVFNNVSFANPVSILASGNRGQIVRTSTGPRVIQLAFKFNF